METIKSRVKRNPVEGNLDPNPASNASVPKNSPQDSACGAVTDALTNHVVLKQVFLLLDTQTLLKLSLVSKIWCRTARLVLRAHKKCLADIKGKLPCQELRNLNKILAKSYDHPYSGLAFRNCQISTPLDERTPQIRHCRIRCIVVEESSDESDSNGTGEDDSENHTDEESLNDNMRHIDEPDMMFLHHPCINPRVTTKTYAAILEKLPFRHLEIHWDGRNGCCPAEKLLCKILIEKGKFFEEMKITAFPESIVSLKEYLKIDTCNWLPKLKILDVFPQDMTPDWNMLDCENPVKCELIEAAPNLEKLLGLNRHFDLDYFLTNGKASLIKHYLVTESDFFGAGDGNQLRRIMNFGISNPKLTKFLFRGYYLDSNPESPEFRAMVDFLKKLILSCSSSLQEILLYHTMFINLLPEIFNLPLRSLRLLTLRVSTSVDQRLQVPVLTKFNWHYVFPALETVKCMPSEDIFSYDSPITDHDSVNIEEQLKEKLVQRRDSSPCESVVKIIFEGHFDLKGLEHFRELFPNVKVFADAGTNCLEEILGFLWKTWPQLEKITFSDVPTSALVYNWDAKLWGISKDGFNQNRGTSSHFLRSKGRTNTVPSIMSFQRLKTLRIEISHPIFPCYPDEKGDSNAHLFSQMDFSKISGFEVEIKRELCNKSLGTCRDFIFDFILQIISS
ncbi:unnamed protein product [Allacma fusca]|uniref:F-box domain-containing protein n=1 Tax=Allacma fusca TaxID=39272 RepID=A0A8J2K5D5_9HEXA|nr:unnamed protein product [Allacma fusca]